MRVSGPGSLKSTARGFLSFTTNKQVRIHDWKLGLSLICLQVCIVLVVIFQIVFQKKFLQSEVPNVVVSMRTEAGRMAQHQEELTRLAREDLGICSSSGLRARSYTYSDAWKYDLLSCSMPNIFEASHKGIDMRSLFITTMSQQTVIKRRTASAPNMTTDECQAFMGEVSGNGTCTFGAAGIASHEPVTYGYRSHTEFDSLLDLNDNGTCSCASSYTTIAAGVEDLVVTVDHSAHTIKHQSFQADTHVRVFGETKVRRSFANGVPNSLTIAEVLEWSNINLDNPVNHPDHRRWWSEETIDSESMRGSVGLATGTYPTLRVTGLRLGLMIEYFNHNQHRSHVEGVDLHTGAETKMVCILTIRPEIATWTSIGDYMVPLDREFTLDETQVAMNTYRYGLLVRVEGGGIISKFDPFILIRTLVEGFVLAQTSTVIIQYVAMYMMGKRSLLYRQLIEEQVTIISAYARFALQALAAAAVFRLLDADSSGILDAREMFKEIEELFGLPADETECLIDLTMADTNVDLETYKESRLMQLTSVAQGELEAPMDKDRAMNLKRFVEIFTGPPCSLAGCEALATELKEIDDLAERAAPDPRNLHLMKTMRSESKGSHQSPDKRDDNKHDKGGPATEGSRWKSNPTFGWVAGEINLDSFDDEALPMPEAGTPGGGNLSRKEPDHERAPPVDLATEVRELKQRTHQLEQQVELQQAAIAHLLSLVSQERPPAQPPSKLPSKSVASSHGKGSRRHAPQTSLADTASDIKETPVSPALSNPETPDMRTVSRKPPKAPKHGDGAPNGERRDEPSPPPPPPPLPPPPVPLLPRGPSGSDAKRASRREKEKRAKSKQGKHSVEKSLSLVASRLENLSQRFFESPKPSARHTIRSAAEPQSSWDSAGTESSPMSPSSLTSHTPVARTDEAQRRDGEVSSPPPPPLSTGHSGGAGPPGSNRISDASTSRVRQQVKELEIPSTGLPSGDLPRGTSVKSKVIAPDYKDRKAGSGRKNSDDSEDSDVEPLSEEHRGRGFRRGAAAGNPLSPLACLGLTPAKLGCLPGVE